MPLSQSQSRMVVACGGTGGHLFPGLAVAELLQERGYACTLVVSPREVDQIALRGYDPDEVLVLPAVGLTSGKMGSFLRGFWESYRQARRSFHQGPPRAVLAMGGFTSAPPVLAAKSLGAATFLHEANAVPGRANRWLAPWVDEVFINFSQAENRLRNPVTCRVGMPVRSQIQPMPAESCRVMLGLEAKRPVLLVMGGSQGAAAINQLVWRAWPALVQQAPELQCLHLTGPGDVARTRAAYQELGFKAVVHPFLTEMELVLNSASVVISRAGASSLAEFAALRLPSILIPYPHAADNHQLANAMAYVRTGAARMVLQSLATPAALTSLVLELLRNPQERVPMAKALAQWHQAEAAEQIAQRIVAVVTQRQVENQSLLEEEASLPSAAAPPGPPWRASRAH